MTKKEAPAVPAAVPRNNNKSIEERRPDSLMRRVSWCRDSIAKNIASFDAFLEQQQQQLPVQNNDHPRNRREESDDDSIDPDELRRHICEAEDDELHESDDDSSIDPDELRHKEEEDELRDELDASSSNKPDRQKSWRPRDSLIKIVDSLDTFLEENQLSQQVVVDEEEDAASIATELRHLSDAEEELRQELDAIVPSSSPPPPELTDVSPISVTSIISEQQVPEKRSGSSYEKEEPMRQTDLDGSNNLQDTFSHRHGDDDEKRSSNNNVSFMERLAMAVFGRREYTIKPMFSFAKKDDLRVRTIQGGVSVAMAVAVAIFSRLHDYSVFFLLLLLLLPPLATWAEVNLPHRTEETIITLGILAVHFVLRWCN